MLPTTRRREQLLHECLAWLGEHYVGGSAADACRSAVREVLHLPLDDRPLTRDMFIGEDFRKALVPYGELLGLGVYEEVHAAEADLRLADTIRRELVEAISQPDLTELQSNRAHLESMVSGLEHWLTHTPGGLAEAAHDLCVLMSGGWSTASFA